MKRYLCLKRSKHKACASKDGAIFWTKREREEREGRREGGGERDRETERQRQTEKETESQRET